MLEEWPLIFDQVGIPSPRMGCIVTYGNWGMIRGHFSSPLYRLLPDSYKSKSYENIKRFYYNKNIFSLGAEKRKGKERK